MADLSLITEAIDVSEDFEAITAAATYEEDWGSIIEDVTAADPLLALTATRYPMASYLEAAGPKPAAHFTTVTMDAGVWQGCYETRVATDYEFAAEFDPGIIAIPAGATRNIRGFSFVSPQLAKQLTAAITLSVKVWGKAIAGPGTMDVRPVMAMCRWLANNTKGTVYANAKIGSAFTTTYTAQVIQQTMLTGLNLLAGDRIAIDLWFQVTNTSGSDLQGRWGLFQAGNASFDISLAASIPLSEMPGISLTGKSWGVL